MRSFAITLAITFIFATRTPAFGTDETVDICTNGLGIPSFGESETEDDNAPRSTLEVMRPPGESVQIPVTSLLPEALIEIPDGGAEAEAQAAASLVILDYLGDTTEVQGPVLTLDEALTLALANNPQLVALTLEVDAQFARVLQAGIKPSPELDLSLSEFLGMNDRRYFRHSVSEVTYTKTIERLEKRLARQRVARLGGDVARWDYEAALRDIQQTVARAYVEVLVAQEQVRIQQKLLSLAEGLQGAVALRYEAGTVSELELSRLKIEVTSARIAFEQAHSDLNAARKKLSALWGDLTPDFEAVAGRINDTLLPPEVEDLIALLPDNPILARFTAEAMQRKAKLELALAESRPDYTVRGGVQGFGDSGEMALTVGISIPTQRGKRNPGDIREAEIRLEQLESQREATRRQLLAQLVDSTERLRAAYSRAEALRSEVIPAGIDNLDRTTVGYRYGKFSYLDVLGSERTLVEAVRSYVDALAEYQSARVDVERLIGRPLATVAKAPEAQPMEDVSGHTDALEPGKATDTQIEAEILEGGNG